MLCAAWRWCSLQGQSNTAMKLLSLMIITWKLSSLKERWVDHLLALVALRTYLSMIVFQFFCSLTVGHIFTWFVILNVAFYLEGTDPVGGFWEGHKATSESILSETRKGDSVVDWESGTVAQKIFRWWLFQYSTITRFCTDHLNLMYNFQICEDVL